MTKSELDIQRARVDLWGIFFPARKTHLQGNYSNFLITDPNLKYLQITVVDLLRNYIVTFFFMDPDTIVFWAYPQTRFPRDSDFYP